MIINLLSQFLCKESDKLTIKDAKRNFVIDAATEIFLEKGIASVTIKDIALAIGVGEATIYRYFSKKHNVVLAVAMKLEDEVYRKYFNFEKEKTGYDKINSFYNSYLKIFKEHKNFYKFISEFDSYILSEDTLILDDYEKGLMPYYQSFIDSYNQGLEDNTIEKVDDIQTFYLSTTHAIMNLCKKLASSDGILSQDYRSNKEKEIKILIDIIMFKIRKN